MALPSVATKSKVRKVLVREITGPIRIMSDVSGNSTVTFEVSKCTVDGKSSNGSDLTVEEASQIKWVVKLATKQKQGASFKLVLAQYSDLATGTGKAFTYKIPTGTIGQAIVAMAYINSPSPKVAHWVKISSSLKIFYPSSITHPALSKFPEIKDVENLEEPFKANWKAFAAALKAAGADVTVNSTLRSRGRVYMMHYCGLVASGAIKPWEVPDSVVVRGDETGEMGVEWTHVDNNGRVDEAASKRAANAMKNMFEIAYPASLTSHHVMGKAIDVSIEWTAKTLKIKKKGTGKDKDGKVITDPEVEITSEPKHGGKKLGNKAGNLDLIEVGESYGVKKHTGRTDAPHWSVDGG